ncbi:MAG: sugar phosphate isomerase/epimerase family protein [Verrucomicrobiota bacterium]
MPSNENSPLKKRELKKGYMLNTFPQGKNLSTLDKFQMLKDAGFEGVEPNSHSDRAEVLDACDKTGLAVASISCGPHTRLFSHPAPSERQKGLDGLRQALQDAKAFGAKSVLVVAGGVDEKTSYAANYQRTQEEIHKAIPLAEELGVVMAIENVWNNFLLSPLEAARYVDEFKSSAVGWHFDVGNVISIGWPEQWIRALGKRIQKIHIKEFSRKKMNEEGLRKGFAVEYLEGDNDWPAIMRAIDEVGYKGWCIVEPACGPCKENVSPEKFLKKISEQLDRILAG